MAATTANAVRRVRDAAEGRARPCRVPATSKPGASTERPRRTLTAARARSTATAPRAGCRARGWCGKLCVFLLIFALTVFGARIGLDAAAERCTRTLVATCIAVVFVEPSHIIYESYVQMAELGCAYDCSACRAGKSTSDPRHTYVQGDCALYFDPTVGAAARERRVILDS